MGLREIESALRAKRLCAREPYIKSTAMRVISRAGDFEARPLKECCGRPKLEGDRRWLGSRFGEGKVVLWKLSGWSREECSAPACCRSLLEKSGFRRNCSGIGGPLHSGR